MRIAVLVKQVPDTWEPRALDPATGRILRDQKAAIVDEICEKAAEVALRVKDEDSAVEVVAVTMGPGGSEDALRRILAMGADRALHILDDALTGADAALTARCLAAALRELRADLIVGGAESTDGAGGIVPAMIAEHLGLASLTGLDQIVVSAGGAHGTRDTGTGELDAEVAFPAVVTITERAAEARFPGVLAVMKAKKKPVTTWSLADLGISLVSGSIVLTATEVPPRTGSRAIVDDGTGGAQLARHLLDLVGKERV